MQQKRMEWQTAMKGLPPRISGLLKHCTTSNYCSQSIREAPAPTKFDR